MGIKGEGQGHPHLHSTDTLRGNQGVQAAAAMAFGREISLPHMAGSPLEEAVPPVENHTPGPFTDYLTEASGTHLWVPKPLSYPPRP